MSRILQQAKVQYKKTVQIEIIVALVVACFFSFWNIRSAVDFLLGFCSALIPFCAFVYVVFYYKQDFSTKLTALYRGEAIKFALTIILIAVAFKWFAIASYIAFFAGFFIALMLNNIIPFLLNRV